MKKNNKSNQLLITENYNLQTPVWVSIIKSFTEGMGYSYARIAGRINVSPSSLQKLIKNPDRRPRDEVFYALCCYFYKVFYSENRSERAVIYVDNCVSTVFPQMVMELKEREMYSNDFLNDGDFLWSEKTKNYSCSDFLQQEKKKIIVIQQPISAVNF